MKKLFSLAKLLLLLLIAVIGTAANSYAEGIQYSGSGFLSLTAGKILGGTSANVEDFNCPCFISDYAQAGVYTNDGVQWRPDTKIGVQGSATYNDFSITGQVVARGATGGADLEWFYGNYNLDENLSVQAGRKRLPMFYYSDVQDIGFALPWTHLPPGLYGWESVNYNGANMRYQSKVFGWGVTANFLVGSEAVSNSGYWKIYNGRQSSSSVKWSNIIGGDLSFSKKWIEARAIYIQSKTEENYGDIWYDNVPSDPTYQTYIPQTVPIYPQAKQRIYGASVNIDYKNFLVRSELIEIDHPGLTWNDHAVVLGAGYRYGKWQPMVTFSGYHSTVVTSGVLPTASQSYAILQPLMSLTLRYDMTESSDIKIQIDSMKDRSDPNNIPNYGDSRLLTISYDRVF